MSGRAAQPASSSSSSRLSGAAAAGSAAAEVPQRHSVPERDERVVAPVLHAVLAVLAARQHQPPLAQRVVSPQVAHVAGDGGACAKRGGGETRGV